MPLIARRPSRLRRFRKALEDMEARGMFLFDLTQPAGLNTKVVRTFVTRCLVGEPGITYVHTEKGPNIYIYILCVYV
jgi:hypothetical protein